jgi:hypothetical protein
VVFDNAKVFGAAQVRDKGLAYGDAEIFDSVRVVNSGEVCGQARIGGRTVVGGDEKVTRRFPEAPPSTGGRGRPRPPRGPRP